MTENCQLKYEESTEPQMSAETYRFVMGWNYYPEPATGERQVKLELHTRLPFSASVQEGAMCLLPAHTQNEPIPGAGFCEGNNYGKKQKPKMSTPLTKERWQTQSSKAAWNTRAERLHKKEVESVERAVSPKVPRVCVMCKDMNPSKNCKLSEQNMASLCSLHNRHRGLIILPGNKRQRPYYTGSLRQKLDEFEKRNRPAKIWRVSTLPTFNRNDCKFLRDDKNEAGEPIKVYRDLDPRLVPEVAFSHDRTEDNNGFDECAFPDDWQIDPAETNGKDDYTFVDTPDSGIKAQCFEMPKPNWVSVTRKYYDNRRCIFAGFQTYYTQDKRTELVRVWKPTDRSFPECIWHLWKPEVHAFTFTVEERIVVVLVRRDLVVMRTEEYPTLINVRDEEQLAREIKQEAKATGRSEHELRAESTILVQSSTVVTKKERKYYNAKREAEKQKRMLTGYMILKDVKEGVAMPVKHKWPIIRSKRAAAPMVQVPMPAGR